MANLSREGLLGASDLTERDVELPSIGGSVRVRSLSAAYSNEAQSEAIELVTTMVRGREQQTARVNTVKLEALQVLHGLVDPKLNSIEDAYTFAQQCGPAWRQVVEAIDAISGIDKEAIERTNAMFQPGGPGEAGKTREADAGPRNGRSDVPVRTGA